MASSPQPLVAKNADQQQDSNQNLDADIKQFDNIITKSLSSAAKGSNHLANMLPTGTVLFYQILNPILFKAGSCDNKYLSIAFLVVCAVVCFILSLTDSFQAPNGKVYYGLATPRGLWTPLLKNKDKMDLSSYKLRPSDFVHASLAVLAFFTTTSFSTDVLNCFVHIPDRVSRSVPTLSGFVISSVFLMIPTTRHGFGFPLNLPGNASSVAPSTASAGSPAKDASGGSAAAGSPAKDASGGSAAAGSVPANPPMATSTG